MNIVQQFTTIVMTMN